MWVLHWKFSDNSDSGVIPRAFSDSEKAALESVLPVVTDSLKTTQFIEVETPAPKRRRRKANSNGNQESSR